jgi:KUP system potassium uptake protein
VSTNGHGNNKLVALAIGAIGVVYGDIGTSPIYALKETFHSDNHKMLVEKATVYGALSRYVMRADNHGEGGILALTSLITGDTKADKPAGITKKSKLTLVILGLFGTALLYGDGMITPAISVLSAVEGFKYATNTFEPYVVPLAIIIIVGLFAVQRFGTGKVGAVFGPIMLVWFAVLAVLGITNIVKHPSVLQALNPKWIIEFFQAHPGKSFLALGALFLVVTGGEALYADMGHFGRKPIALGWFALVMPCLVLNYFGQGALILAEGDGIFDEEKLQHPFFKMGPDWAIWPLAILATMATIIASQALISGVFSLTQQAMNLGYAPRTPLVHTSSTEKGQIYIPAINWSLMIACVALVLGFQSSGALAAAYGLAVTATMVITALLFGVVATERWGWSKAKAWSLSGLFLVVDLGFLIANVFKIPQGGWFPLVVGIGIFTLLTTWKKGRELVAERMRKGREPLSEFAQGLLQETSHRPMRFRGTAVFMFSEPGVAPPALIATIRYHASLHETVYVVSVHTTETPTVDDANRIVSQHVGAGITQVTISFGYFEEHRVPPVLKEHFKIPDNTVYFVGRERVMATKKTGMALWRESLFVTMNKNAADVANFFSLPSDHIVEVGTRVDI